jgi:hypothetical protein
MSTVRRRVLRPQQPIAEVDLRRQRQITRQSGQLALHRCGLNRWMTRLRRALNAVEKHQRAVSRLERKLAELE